MHPTPDPHGVVTVVRKVWGCDRVLEVVTSFRDLTRGLLCGTYDWCYHQKMTIFGCKFCTTSTTDHHHPKLKKKYEGCCGYFEARLACIVR